MELTLHSRQAGPPAHLPSSLLRRRGQASPQRTDGRTLGREAGSKETQAAGRVEGLGPRWVPTVPVRGGPGPWQGGGPGGARSGAATPGRRDLGDFALTKFLRELAEGAGGLGLGSGPRWGLWGSAARPPTLSSIY